MDALAHCLEAYCSPFYHPMSQGIALEGMRLVFENLPKVYADPNDLDARAAHDVRRRDGRGRVPEGAWARSIR